MNLLYTNDRTGCYPDSWYAATVAPTAQRPPLRGRHRADVCIIGGGYTGLSAALHLAQAGRSVILLEAQRVGFGASGRNGGQVGTGHRVDQMTLTRQYGADTARALWEVSEAAKTLVRDLIAEHQIDAQLRPGIVQAERQPRYLDHYRDEAAFLADTYGYTQMEPLDRAGLERFVDSPLYAGGAVDWGGAHLHALAYALGLARAAEGAGATLHEGAEVHRLDPGQGTAPHRVSTASGWVEAPHVLIAANGYLGNLVPQIAARVMPINSFVAVTPPLPPGTALREPVAVADSNFVVNYFRLTPDHRLLFGGGESYGYRFPKDLDQVVRRPLSQVFPQLADIPFDHVWGGTLAITLSRMPHFTRLTPTILSASGYSGHGVALASLAGKLMAQAIAGQTEGFDLLARLPSPRFPGGSLARRPLLALAMTWYGLRDRLGL